jgi:hypothetical protein
MEFNNINTYNVNRILKVEVYSKTASLVQILEDLDFPSSKKSRTYTTEISNGKKNMLSIL